MVKIILSLLITQFIFSQSIFDTYRLNDQVSYVSVSPQMFSMLAKLNIDVDDPEAKEFIELVSKIKVFKLLRTGEPSISKAFSDWTNAYVKENKLEELMQVRDNETNIFFYALNSDQDHIVDEIVMLVQDDGEVSNLAEIEQQTVILLIQGSINLNRISSLSQKLNLPAGDQLKKFKIKSDSQL